MSILLPEILIVVCEHFDYRICRPLTRKRWQDEEPRPCPLLPVMKVCRFWRDLLGPLANRRLRLNDSLQLDARRRRKQLLAKLSCCSVRVSHVREVILSLKFYDPSSSLFINSTLDLLQKSRGFVQKVTLQGTPWATADPDSLRIRVAAL